MGEPQAAHKEELLHRLQNVAALTKERLLADFPRTDVRSALAMFDRRLVQKGFGPTPDVDVRRFCYGACASWRLSSAARKHPRYCSTTAWFLT